MNKNVSDMLLIKESVAQFLFKASEHALVFSFYGQNKTSAQRF